MLEKNKSQIRSVVNKTEKLDNTYRTPILEILAGDNNLQTELKEHDCKFELDFQKVN